MGSQIIQILVLAGVALFLVLRLKNTLGTRGGFEAPREKPGPVEKTAKNRSFSLGRREFHRL